jgi:uncharacterized membrane protein/thiol-disulfide isomerase/thioredoxin
MNLKRLFLISLLLLVLLGVLAGTASAQDQPRVRALLFYSPTCPHCEQVIRQELPPLQEEYGDALLVLYINISTEQGNALFFSTLETIGYPLEQAGVPFMIIGEEVLVGSGRVPTELPPIIEDGLAAGGIPWPEIPAIQEMLLTLGYMDENGADITPTPAPTDEAAPTGEAAPTATTAEQTSPTDAPAATETLAPTAAPPEVPSDLVTLTTPEDDFSDTLLGTFASRFNRDPLGNGIAVVVLLFLIGVVVFIGVQFMRAAEPKRWPEWILPVLLVIGLAIAIYLATIEVTGEEAICGPVGDCNAVQSSEYATLFGFLPVAILGVIGYVLIGGSWLVSHRTSGKAQFYSQIAMFVFALFALLFFIYLTFLEPFVIGATCAWCVSSAIIVALINLYSLPIVLQAWAQQEVDMVEEEDQDE